jgi:hypothetical protein
MKWKKRQLVSAMMVLVMLLTTTSSALAKSNVIKLPFDPDNFVRKIDNPYFPLKPGTTFIYKGQVDGTPTRDVMTVTHQTKVILGVTTTVVHDRGYEDGILTEDTFDWFAQDKQGNVWYFGENTKELDEKGNVISTEGTWQAGVDGAKPGIVMLAHPHKGDKYRQEFAPDVAEDMAQVLGFKDSLCVPYGCFKHVLVIKEWTPLEPGVVENKYYAKGVGFIYSEMVQGGNETLALVRIRHQNGDNDNEEDKADD